MHPSIPPYCVCSPLVSRSCDSIRLVEVNSRVSLVCLIRSTVKKALCIETNSTAGPDQTRRDETRRDQIGFKRIFTPNRSHCIVHTLIHGK